MTWSAPRLALLALLACPVAAAAQVEERVIYVSVVDKAGAPVFDLTSKDFVVREDGVAREILGVTRDTDPLQIALLIDNSAPMQNSIVDLRRAAAAFVDATHERVPIALITLAERPTIAAGYTTDRAVLHRAIDRLFAYRSGNYLLDGIAETSQGLSKRTMWRSAIVAITAMGPEMSYRDYTAVLRFFREGGASLHVIALGTSAGAPSREIVLGKGTEETGGRYDNVFAASGLEFRARQTASEVSNQYRITYARPERLVPPRNTEVSVRRTDLHARGMLMKTDKDR